MWIPLLPTLTALNHVAMLDRVGDLNKSRATTHVASPTRVVDWIDQALDALEIERAAFVALSIGSWMAAHYAMARPHRVERLALMSPVGLVINQHPKWLAAMADHTAVHHRNAGLPVQSARAAPRPMQAGRLAASRIPVLVVVPRGETLHDGTTMASRFRHQLPHARVELIDNANHVVPIDQPDVVNELLATFLSA